MCLSLKGRRHWIFPSGKRQHEPEVPAKRSQQFNATYIATLLAQYLQALPNGRNISTLQIATLLGATCCTRLATMLRRVAACCELKIELVHMPWRNIVAQAWPNDHNNKQHLQMLYLKNLTIFKFEPTTPNMSQHITTSRNRVAKRTQHAGPNNVVICCIEILRSFGRGLSSFETST